MTAPDEAPGSADNLGLGRTLRALGPSIFLPTMVYQIGTGAIAPVIALTAIDVGASPALAGFMVAMLGIGRIVGDIPASWLAEHIGDRRSMIAAAALDIGALVVCVFAGAAIPLAIGLLLIGISSATFNLPRQSYLTEMVPIRYRARAMSTLAGSHRIGLFIGPFAGALVISLTDLKGAYLVAILAAAVSATLLLTIPDVSVPKGQEPTIRGTVTTREIVKSHWRLFVSLGAAILAVAAVRGARQTVLPLWSDHLGLSATQTSIIFGIASAVDISMFYPAGKVMDKFGRLAIGIPSMIILGGSMIVLPFTSGVTSLTIVAMIMSLGNGIGAGIMLTLGADAAPVVGRLRFFGVWRILSDSGNAAGPVIVAVVAVITSLAAGIIVTGAVGLLAAFALAVSVPKYAPRGTSQHRSPTSEPDRA